MKRIISLFNFLFLLSVWVLLTVGCGGSSSPEPAPMPEENRVQQNIAEKTGLDKKNKDSDSDSEEKAQPKKKKKKKKKVQKEDPAAAAAAEEEALKQEFLPKEQTLPAESAQWMENEFNYIRMMQPKLFDLAIEELTKRLANPDQMESAAELLSNFVKSLIPEAIAKEDQLMRNAANIPESEDGEDGPRRNDSRPVEVTFYQLSSNQVRDALSALASSNAEAAQKTIAAFLAGAFLTDENKSGMEVVLDAYGRKAAKKKITPQEEALLLTFLLMPEAGVAQAADFAEVKAPEIPEIQYDENGRPIQNQEQTARRTHQPILVAPGKKVQFKFVGGPGTLNSFTPYDVQKAVLAKFCPSSSPLFRARIAAELTSETVLEAADTVEKQAFLLTNVLDNFLMKKDPANAIAQISIYRQPDLDEKWKTSLEESLKSSHENLLQCHFLMFDEKVLQEYKNALAVRRSLMDEEQQAEREAKESSKTTNTEQVPVSLLSRKAAVTAQTQTSRTSNQNQTNYSAVVQMLLNPAEREGLEKELWTPEIRDMLLTNIAEMLQSHVGEMLTSMEEIEEGQPLNRIKVPTIDRKALQPMEIYLTIPCTETRYQIFSLLDQAWILGPEVFRNTLLSDRMLVEPGFHMILKSMERKMMPKSKEKKNKKNARNKRNAKAPSKKMMMRERKKEVAEEWMLMAYKSASQWCAKVSQMGKMEREVEEAALILEPNAPKLPELELPKGMRSDLGLPLEMKVVSYFEKADPVMPPISEASGLKITFFEAECVSSFSGLVKGFKSKIPQLAERGMPEGNQLRGMPQGAIQNAFWLERFELNEETGKRESIDILIAPKSRNSENRPNMGMAANFDWTKVKGDAAYSVYFLKMEMDDLSVSDVSHFQDDESDEEEDEEADEDGDSEDSDEDYSDDSDEESEDEFGEE